MIAEDTLYEAADWRVVRLDPARDEPAVTELSLACADYALLVTGENPKQSDGADFFRDAPPGHPAESMLKLGILDRDDRMLGVIDVVRDYPEPATWYVGLLLIHPDHRRRGLGRAAMAGLEGFARDAGISRLMLSVVGANADASRFWTSLGFRETRRIASRIGAKDHALIEFERRLQERLTQQAVAASFPKATRKSLGLD